MNGFGFLSRLTRRGDDGVALVVAIALLALSGTLVLTMTTLVMRETHDTSRDRARSAAVMTAEGGVDNALATIQGTAIAGLPCTSTVSKTDSKPQTISITTTTTYYDATGAASPSCPPADTFIATQALIKSVATTTPAGGGMKVKRTVETLVQLKPKYANDLDRAIFGQSGVQVANNFDLYGQTGPDADVYTNGDFVCAHNEHFRGSVYAQGAITLSNSCTIDVNAWSKTGFSSSSPQSTVGGDVLVSNGTANISAGTIGGKVKAQTITPASFCTANPSKCVTGVGSAPPPTSIDFPQLGNNTAPWVAAGYQIVNKTDCTNTSSSNNPGNWLATSGNTLTQKTLLVTPCTLTFKPSVKTVSLKQDVAIFATGGVDLEQSLKFTSTNTTKHYLYFVQPYGSACVGTNPKLGIYLGNLVVMDPTISELLYTPCDVHKANQSSTYGQIYAGGVAYIDNKTDAYYVPIPVFGVTAVKRVVSYTADILYKRERLG